MNIVLLLVGLAILVKWADFFVDWASGLAKRIGLPPFIIGLTVVALGTSAPELFVNLQSAINWHTELAIWNILGSNIANILFICGVCALIWWVQMDKIIHQNFAISLLFGVLLWIVSLTAGGTIGVIWGVVLLIATTAYLYYMFKTSEKQDILEAESTGYPYRKLILMVAWWLTALILGSNMAVKGAVSIAGLIWLSERIIGLTIIAIGTSLPELITTVVSIRKGQWEMWIGNIVWSNILNIGLIGGITALIHPVIFYKSTYLDLFVYLWVTILVLILLFIGKKYKITKVRWWLFLLLYIIYVAYIIIQG